MDPIVLHHLGDGIGALGEVGHHGIRIGRQGGRLVATAVEGSQEAGELHGLVVLVVVGLDAEDLIGVVGSQGGPKVVDVEVDVLGVVELQVVSVLVGGGV